ncbi:MAG: hypothetical protein M3Z08_09765 [Chloroflexota bacterium]|nr:hypothetical protein [Chloroflexota bacterium]
MNPVEILERWVEPVTGPLKDFTSTTESLATNHQTSVTNFKNLLDQLTDVSNPDAFVGDGADAMTSLMEDYILSEFALSGTAMQLAGPVAQFEERGGREVG